MSTDLIDTLLARLDSREAGVSPAQVVAEVLIDAVHDQAEGARSLETYHHAYGESTSLRSGLLRMWSEFEDRITEHLARERGGVATP